MRTFDASDITSIPIDDIQLARKKPLIIRCVQMTEEFEVETLEGLMRGKSGDYLMIGVRGELYICDREIFKETYDIL